MLILVVLTALFRLVDSSTGNNIVPTTENSTVVWITRNSIVSSTGNSIVLTTGNKLITWVDECCPNNIATSWSQQALNNLLTACNNMMIFTRVNKKLSAILLMISSTSCKITLSNTFCGTTAGFFGLLPKAYGAWSMDAQDAQTL